MEKETVEISVEEYNLLKIKAGIFDLVRERDSLNIKISQINGIIQQKLKELEELENKK